MARLEDLIGTASNIWQAGTGRADIDISGVTADSRQVRAGYLFAALPGSRAEISALVPLAELQDYLSRLKAITGGEGTYTMDLSHYDPVPPRRQQELIGAYKPHEEAD